MDFFIKEFFFISFINYGWISLVQEIKKWFSKS